MSQPEIKIVNHLDDLRKGIFRYLNLLLQSQLKIIFHEHHIENYTLVFALPNYY